jgi:pimeloyl-ACP methyl ester carboxylesterase
MGMLCAGGWTVAHLTSSAVRQWRPGAGQSRAAGRLQVRMFGSGRPVVVLLHGLAAAGDCFGIGFDPLGDHAIVVVPDLLGFGGSRTNQGPLTAADHLDALDEALEALGLADRLLVVVGHSMGGALALRWAARHTPRVCAVVTLCAALYRNRDEADGRLSKMGPAEAVFAGDGPLPQLLCGWMCRHRALASWIAVALRPDLPVTVARSAVEHTWDGYHGSLQGCVRSGDWEPALAELSAAGIPITFLEAAQDPVPIPGRAAAFAAALPAVHYEPHPTAGHLLPLSDASWCAARIAVAGDLDAHSHPRKPGTIRLPPESRRCGPPQ